MGKPLVIGEEGVRRDPADCERRVDEFKVAFVLTVFGPFLLLVGLVHVGWAMTAHDVHGTLTSCGSAYVAKNGHSYQDCRFQWSDAGRVRSQVIMVRAPARLGQLRTAVADGLWTRWLTTSRHTGLTGLGLTALTAPTTWYQFRRRRRRRRERQARSLYLAGGAHGGSAVVDP